jgi:phosphotriesterase-related protein
LSTVDTVRGPVPIAELGPTLAHEHLISISAEFEKFYPELSWAGSRQTRVDAVVDLVQGVRDRGITTILDCTAFFHGRDQDFLRDVNERVDINLIVSTGIYTFDYLPYHLIHRPSSPVADDLLTRMFLRDLTVGIGDSGVKAQSIKVATDVEGITANNERVLRAAAFASAETGAPITAHTHPADGLGPRIQEIFSDLGVNLANVVLGHSGDSTDLDYLRTLMDNGSVIGSDRFGLYLPGTASEEERVQAIATLCGEGYANRIVLSHDTVMFSDWGPPGGTAARFPSWVPTHICDKILPALRATGVSQADIDTMMVSTPASLFAGLAN